MRASAVAESAGVPTASLVCEGFAGLATATAGGLGIASMPVARLVGHVDPQGAEELRANVEAVTVPDVVRCLTRAPAPAEVDRAYAPEAIVARGSIDEIDAVFEARGWRDGLPIVPPTPERVRAFLACADDDPDRVIGALRPSGSAVTPRNVAVNGVMAGCRPEYMPVLVGIAEVLADPGYGVGHSGDTTGGEAQIILSGPVVRDLGFNCSSGALRDGYRANTSVGRFLRLLLRNVARFLPGAADKSTFGHNWRVVLAEDEVALAALGWPSFGRDRGFEEGESVVTVGRFTGDTVVGAIYGKDPDPILRYIADGLVRQNGWEYIFTTGFAAGTNRPLVVLGPLVAATLARAGISKADLRARLFEYARLPARALETYIGAWTNLVPGRRTLAELVADGIAPPVYAESDDPERLVPSVARAQDILVVVSGDPYRSNAMVHGSNGMHGFPISRAIRR